MSPTRLLLIFPALFLLATASAQIVPGVIKVSRAAGVSLQTYGPLERERVLTEGDVITTPAPINVGTEAPITLIYENLAVIIAEPKAQLELTHFTLEAERNSMEGPPSRTRSSHLRGCAYYDILPLAPGSSWRIFLPVGEINVVKASAFKVCVTEHDDALTIVITSAFGAIELKGLASTDSTAMPGGHITRITLLKNRDGSYRVDSFSAPSPTPEGLRPDPSLQDEVDHARGWLEISSLDVAAAGSAFDPDTILPNTISRPPQNTIVVSPDRL